MALEGEGSNCFSITQLVGQKGSNKVSKCKLKKYLFGKKKKKKKNERKTGKFRNSMIIIISPLAA